MDARADIRHAFRLLARTPVFTVAAIATLALGIGANTTIFSLVQSVLVRPLPYANPDELVMVWEDATFVGFPKNTPAPGNYNEWRIRNRSFVDMAATRGGTNGSLTLDGPPEQVQGRAVTVNFFDVLGVAPALGRSFSSGDARGADVVIISNALWRRRYASDPAIVGRTIVMNDVRHEVVGVAPKSFVFRDRGSEGVPRDRTSRHASVWQPRLRSGNGEHRPGTPERRLNLPIGWIVDARAIDDE